MALIELSAGLHTDHQPAASSSNMPPNNRSTAASSTTGTHGRQQASQNCSTRSSATALRHAKSPSRASSVRSRAAFFEAMSISPPGRSPPHDRGSPAGSTLPEQVLLSRSLDASHCASKAASPQTAGQEVEMVDQAAQGSREGKSQTQPAGCTQTHVIPDTPARPRFRRRSLSDIKHSSCCEVQLQIAESCHDRPSCSRNVSAKPAGPQAAVPAEGNSTLLDTDADHGIELQEQGHAEMLEHALERLTTEVAERDKQSVAAASALACKTQECASLMGVVRELTENRSKLVCARTNLAEKLAEMQHEYMRLMRVADLSRVVSKENVAKTAKVMKTLKQVEDESARQQHLIGYFKERNKNLKDENLELRERLCLLERLDLLSYSRDSVCMREFKVHALKETY
ncbi:hypothetical protein ABBQ32_013033 [Trebouxia sp. C0010 RCD-2024]